MFKLGKIEIPHIPLLLAPMEDVTDISFRYICKIFGADIVYTEFVASEALIRNVDKTFRKMKLFEEDRPIGIQIYGHNIDSMVESAKIISNLKPDIIDINFGCPVKKIANRGAGAGMLQDIPKMIKMTQSIVKATDIPVTVKTRLSWDNESPKITEFAEALQDAGIKALTVHGRTRKQMYKGEADWTLIGELKNNPRIKIPIIGNGDIDSAQKAKLMINKYNVDALMIGRASYGKPWIFNEIKHYLITNELLKPLTLKEKIDVAKKHFKRSIDWKGDKKGIYEMRRHFSSYFKGLPNFKDIRLKLLTCVDTDEIINILDEIHIRYGSDYDHIEGISNPWLKKELN